MRGGGAELAPGALENPADVRVDGQYGPVEREPRDRVSRVPADARKVR